MFWTSAKVILLEDVKSLGKKGQLVDVSDGYARNCLIKNGLATPATSTQINSIKISRAAEEKRRAAEKAEAVKLAARLEQMTVTVEIKTGETGKLFGALNTQAIADALEKQGVSIGRIYHYRKTVRRSFGKTQSRGKTGKINITAAALPL